MGGINDDLRPLLLANDRVEEQPHVQALESETFDWLGRPASQRKLGGKKTFPFSLGKDAKMSVCESIICRENFCTFLFWSWNWYFDASTREHLPVVHCLFRNLLQYGAVLPRGFGRGKCFCCQRHKQLARIHVSILHYRSFHCRIILGPSLDMCSVSNDRYIGELLSCSR